MSSACADEARAALDAMLARLEEAERERKAAEEWARTMEHERDYEQQVVVVDLELRLEAAEAERDRLTDALRGYVTAHHRELHIGRFHEWELRVTDAVRDEARAALAAVDGTEHQP